MTTILKKQNTDTISKAVSQIIYRFLWGYVPRILSSIIWNVQADSEKCMLNYEDEKQCVIVVTSARTESDYILIKELADLGYTVIVGVNSSSDKFEGSRAKTKKGLIEAFQLDLRCMKSVETFAKEVTLKYSEISFLINNHNEFVDKYLLTEDALEYNNAVNYLGQFYLTHLLLENLKTTGQRRPYYCKVINLTSPELYGAQIYFDDFNHQKDRDPVRAFEQAKLAMLMMTKYLEEQMRNHQYAIQVCAVNAGHLESSRSILEKIPLLRSLMPPASKTASKSIIYACFKREMFGGQFYCHSQDFFTSSYSKNSRLQEDLFQLTCDLLGLKVFGTGSAELTEKSIHKYEKKNYERQS